MTKEFVPYKLSVKLKQLGFDEEGFGTYNVNGDVLPFKPYTIESKAILFSQAFRWFREKYGLQHDITLTADKELTGFYVLIHKLDGLVFNEDDAVELDIETTNREDVELIILNKMIEIVTKQQEPNISEWNGPYAY
jgi:hypothetical protein